MTKIELASKVKVTQLNNYEYLLVDADTASWTIIDEETYNAIFTKKLRYFSKKILGGLYSAGLLSINDKRAVSPIRFDKYKKPDPLLGVIKASARCNMRCKYCYAEAERNKSLMSIDTAKKCVDFMAGVKRKDFRIVLHGGEPLCVGKNWLVEFLEYVDVMREKYKKNISVGIQTNGTLISKEIANILSKHNVGVGISIDGPAEINDEVRPFYDGLPSTESTIRGIKLLITMGIEVGIISVVTKLNFNRIKEVLSFFRSLGISDIKFLSCSAVMGRSRYHPEIHISPTEYFIAMKDAIEYCLDDGGVVIKPVSYLLENIISWERRFMCSRSPCGAANNIFTFDTDGSIYPCDEIVGLSEYIIGNIWKNTIDEVLYHPVAIKFRNRTVDKIKECSKCLWRNFCGSGCATRALLKTGTLMSKDEFCEYYKRIIPYLIKLIYNKKQLVLKKLLPYWDVCNS